MYDSTLNNYEHARRLVEETMAAGKSAHVVYVYRPIEVAFRGVLERSKTEGRTVSVGTIIKTHTDAGDTARKLAGELENERSVRFRFIDNSQPLARQGELQLTQRENYGDKRNSLVAILESWRDQLSVAPYEASKG